MEENFSETFVMDKGTVGNTNYLAIPFNSINKAGAALVINTILSPEMQSSKANPLGKGDITVIEEAFLNTEEKALFVLNNEGTISIETLESKRLPEFSSEVVPLVEKFGERKYWVVNRGRHLLRLLLMTPLIVPIVSVSMGIQINFVPLGIVNSFLAFLIIHIVLAIPYAVWFIMDSFQLIGLGRESQEIQLGANRWQVFIHITLPDLLPTLIIAGGFVFIFSFSQYFVTMFLGGGQIRTLTMDMFPYIASGQRAIGSVYSILFLVILIISLLIGKQLIKKYQKKKEF
ncbi:hypothetical protein AZF37_07715 [endosymbiont 'TC1' of Trimyema compressum]|uniref:ABC transporter permease subunit n=1 Tax=endosymbiont 'TC1' of Trimyema compressum TaxID=243899 RepID=UPI0007F15F52|nr:ABC transporter permease subunit [endosymbiont 'TC1' of Trimyema compressum]AMP21066.1 hypothetical protein AZF37_07715 [endosymbiont 'TC1' of Trimyema compressum]